MKISFLAKKNHFIIIVPDYEFLENNTIRGLETPKQFFQFIFLKHLMKKSVERDILGEKHVSAYLNDVKSVSTYY